jgi:hypothetical protein
MTHYYCKLFFIAIFAISCTNHLLLPIKGGRTGKTNAIPSNNTETQMFVYPTISSEVRASENSIVIKIFKVDEAIVVMTKGKYKIAYSNLAESYVKENQVLKKSQIIGKVNSEAEGSYDSYLIIGIQDLNGENISDYKIFGKGN